MADIKFVAVQDLGTAATRTIKKWDGKGYSEFPQELKVQIGTWESEKSKGKREPKFDIRWWNEDGTCDKGLSLTPEEAQGLYDLLKKNLEED